MFRKASYLLLFAFIVLFVSSQGSAQVNVATATLKGTITDPTGAVVPGAVVTARSVNQGVSRQTTTNETGDYLIPLLNPGDYEVTVEAGGFKAQAIGKINLTVGQTFVSNGQLELTQIEKRYVANTETPLIEPERSQQSNTIERRQIETLPNTARIFTDYIFILPGVVNTDIPRLQNTRISQLRNSGLSIGGGNGQLNYVSVDGGENEFGTGALRIRNLSVESIQEFQVNRNAFTAEFGFTTGTAINAVTKSGGNSYHGSFYGFYRSDELGARNPLIFAEENPYNQNIFSGVNGGGPIKKNRAFFFASYEALRGDDTRVRSYISDNPALLKPTAAQEAYLSQLSSGPNATSQTVRIAGTLRALLTGTNFPRALAFLRSNEGAFPLKDRSYTFTSRVDYEQSARNIFNGRYTFSDEDANNLSLDNFQAAGRALTLEQHDYTAVGTWSHIFNDGLYNQFRFQFANNNFEQVAPTQASPSISIGGLGDFGPAFATPLFVSQERFQFDDTLAWTRGKHNFKFGVTYRPVRYRVTSNITFNGDFQFYAGLPPTLALSPADQAVLTGPLAAPLEAGATSLQGFFLGLPFGWGQGFGNGFVKGTQHAVGFFEQDSWKPNRRTTIDYGLRLDYENRPGTGTRGINVSPRIGFAVDAFGNGKTVVRGGGGLFYAVTGLQTFTISGVQSEQEVGLIIAGRSLFDGPQSSVALWNYGQSLGKLPFRSLTEADVRAFGINVAPRQPGRRLGITASDYESPYSMQASLGISQLLARDLTLDVAYQFYRGVHLPIAAETNFVESGRDIDIPGAPDLGKFLGPQLVPIDPAIGSRILYASWGNSVYHGATIGLTKRFNRLTQFTANYTYSKSIDDAYDFLGLASPFIPTRRFLDRSLSAFDLRHNFVAHGSFESPFKRGAGQPWYARALADITLSPIVFARSGFPFTLFLGTDINGDTNTADRPYFAPRNSGKGPLFFGTNLRLMKRLYVNPTRAEGLRVDFIVEANNLFNRTNFLRVNDEICSTGASAGSISGCDVRLLTGPFDLRGSRDISPRSPLGYSVAAPGRQLQFGLKLVF